MFSAEHVRNSQSTTYLKSHGCVHGFQHEVSLIKGRHKRESKNKKQETKRFSTFAVSRLRHSEPPPPPKKKTLLDSRIKFLAKHV